MARLIDSRPFRRGLALAWTLLILVLCWMPRNGLRLPEDDAHWLRIPHLDKFVHATLFAGFAVFWSACFSSRRRAPIILAAGLFLAILTEYVQSLPIVGRDADLLDGLADASGLVIGLVLVALMREWAPDSRMGRLLKCP